MTRKEWSHEGKAPAVEGEPTGPYPNLIASNGNRPPSAFAQRETTGKAMATVRPTCSQNTRKASDEGRVVACLRERNDGKSRVLSWVAMLSCSPGFCSLLDCTPSIRGFKCVVNKIEEPRSQNHFPLLVVGLHY
jgi:hypothetical protein